MTPATGAPGRYRILHVLPDLGIGGGQTIVLQHVRHADRDTFDVGVCHVLPQDTLAPAFVEAGVTPERLDLGSRVALAGAVRSLATLAGKADVLHVHSDLDRKIGHAAALVARVPVVGHLHAEWVHLGVMSPGEPTPLRRARARASGLARDWLERRAVRHYVASSREVRDVFAPLVRAPITVMTQGVALDRLAAPNQAAVRRLRQELAGGGGPVLLCVSRLAPGKGQGRLVAMLPAILDRWPSATLVLVGDGDTRRAVEAQVALAGLASSVRFLGGRLDVPELLAAADVFVFASETEGFGLSVLEAMAASVPVVAFRLPALEEFVGDGTGGFLVGREDERSFVARVDELLGDPLRASAVGKAGRAAVERRHAPDAIARSLEDVYRTVLGECPPSRAIKGVAA